MRVLVTGAAGFIGSAYVRHLRATRPEDRVVALDRLTYAGRRENLNGVEVDLVEGSVEDPAAVEQAMRGCDAVVNLAAETHVDRSIVNGEAFARTHVMGTGVLLEAARRLGVGRFVQVSTDEVYGSAAGEAFTESSPLDPSSPYSATKAGGDLLVAAHARTHGLEAMICRGSNAYGPRQHPEKLIPLAILNALAGEPIPVYGDGRQVRTWLWVEDFAAAIDRVLLAGRPGLAYNAGGPDELENLDVVHRVLELTGRGEELIEHVRDRPGHDRRYALSSERLEGLGWSARVRFDRGLERTVDWYRDNPAWWRPVREGEYRDWYHRQYGRRLDG